MDFKEEGPWRFWMLFTSWDFIFFPRKKRLSCMDGQPEAQVSFLKTSRSCMGLPISSWEPPYMNLAPESSWEFCFLISDLIPFPTQLNTPETPERKYLPDRKRQHSIRIQSKYPCAFLSQDPGFFSKLKERGHGIHRTRINRQNVLLAYEQIPDTGNRWPVM